MTWDDVFRRGVAPAMTTPELEALAAGLRADDPALAQRCVCLPPIDWTRAEQPPCEGGCAVGYAAMRSGLSSLVSVSRRFGEVAADCNRRLRHEAGAAVRFFTAFFDEGPRAEVFAKLLPEVERAIRERGQ